MWTPLQYVCATGNSYRTKEIVKKHPNLLEARGETAYAYTPLHIAARYGHTDIIQLLLSHGANRLSKEAKSGCTALHFAAAYGHMEAIRALLSMDSVFVTTNNGTLAHDIARRNGHFHASNLIISSMRQYECSALLHSWLASIGLIEYASNFESAGLNDPEYILEYGISDQALAFMNISKIGHSQKIKCLYRLREFLQQNNKINTSNDNDNDSESSDVESQSSFEDGEAIDTEQNVSETSSEIVH